jgi:hypothetical protein
MRKPVTALTLQQYRSAIEYGVGTLITFENFTLLHGTDADDNCRYLVVESLDCKPVDFEGDGSNLKFYELSLEDFHQLCTYYLISLQPEMEHARKTFNDELLSLRTLL